jgi:hypothetical protein
MRRTRITAFAALALAAVACGIDAVGTQLGADLPDGGDREPSSTDDGSTPVVPEDAEPDVTESLDADATSDTGLGDSGPDVAPLVPPYLVLTHAPVSGTINLTTEGTTEWAYWGANGTLSSTRKGNVSNQISALYYTSGAPVTVATGFGATFTWSDGETGSATGSGDWFARYPSTTADYFYVSAPSGSLKQTLVVFVGGTNIRGKMTASFSNGATTDKVDNTYVNLAGTIAVKYVLEYASVTPTYAELTWEPESVAAGGAEIRFAAAALR